LAARTREDTVASYTGSPAYRSERGWHARLCVPRADPRLLNCKGCPCTLSRFWVGPVCTCELNTAWRGLGTQSSFRFSEHIPVSRAHILVSQGCISGSYARFHLTRELFRFFRSYFGPTQASFRLSYELSRASRSFLWRLTVESSISLTQNIFVCDLPTSSEGPVFRLF